MWVCYRRRTQRSGSGRSRRGSFGDGFGAASELIGLADTTRRIIGQNVWLAFGLSVVLIALAARGIFDPLTGALAQSVAVFAVVANSARILRFTGKYGTRIPADTDARPDLF